jgi:flagellar biosynthesis protein FlhB
MPESDGQEKTEQPSQKKLKDGREKGQVAKSTEINSLAIFSTGLMLLYFSQTSISERISEFSIKIFSSLDVLKINNLLIVEYAKAGMFFIIITLIPIFGGLFVISIVAGVAQVGFELSPKAMQPDFTRFNPLTGIKKAFFSAKSFEELIKSVVKLVVISLGVYFVLKDQILESTKLYDLTISEIAGFMIHSAFQLTWKVALIYSIVAASDFIFQKFNFKKEMMMSKQEVKEENRQSEGDPLVKSRIKKIQYMMAKNRMMQEVPKADVVITNPTHFAVAVKYDMLKDSAPKVVAKGADEIALKIKEIAAKNNVPLHEDVELARALYKYCNIGEVIPEKLFKAVAQILAYVFQLKNKKIKKSIV